MIVLMHLIGYSSTCAQDWSQQSTCQSVYIIESNFSCKECCSHACTNKYAVLSLKQYVSVRTTRCPVGTRTSASEYHDTCNCVSFPFLENWLQQQEKRFYLKYEIQDSLSVSKSICLVITLNKQAYFSSVQIHMLIIKIKNKMKYGKSQSNFSIELDSFHRRWSCTQRQRNISAMQWLHSAVRPKKGCGLKRQTHVHIHQWEHHHCPQNHQIYLYVCIYLFVYFNFLYPGQPLVLTLSSRETCIKHQRKFGQFDMPTITKD